MKEGQKQIFYITGDEYHKLTNHPQLEGFKKRDIEVLLLSDHVDDFWVSVVNKYKNNECKSVSHSDVDLDSISKLNDGDINNKNEKEASSSDDKGNVDLINYFKDVLGDGVKDVKVSSKLINSPACISIPDGYMSSRMEKYLIEQKQLSSKVAKILEINPSHPLIKRISNGIEVSKDNEDIKNLVHIVFGQACIIEGEDLEDPRSFVTMVNDLLEKNK